MAASPCADAAPRWRRAARVGVAAAALLLTASRLSAEGSRGEYWLQFGKPVRLCPGARDPVPAKVEGATWGVLASGVLLCRDLGNAYALTLSYLNVAIDPDNKALLKQDTVAFDWIGLSLYRAAQHGEGVDWLFDAARPVRGELRHDATRRIVFGNIAFTVPKGPATQATNMMLYLTFGSPLVALHVS